MILNLPPKLSTAQIIEIMAETSEFKQFCQFLVIEINSFLK